MWKTLALCLALLFGPSLASAKVHHRAPKFFSANKDSVAEENLAGNEILAYRYFTQAQVDNDVQLGKLSAFYDRTVYVISPKLPMERRYALPATVDFIYELSKEHYWVFRQPLMVDSAIRPATAQRALHLRNAAPAYGLRASSHERGVSIDLSKKQNKQENAWMVSRLLYYRAIGRILVIQEKSCWHIMVLS